VPSIEQLLKFLMARFQTLQAVMANNKKAKMPPQKSWEKKRYTNLVVAEKCKFCTSEHSLDKCEKFTKLNLVNKNNFIHANNLCKVCLSHHSKFFCKSTIKCTQCKGSHHTLLHEVKQQETSTTVHHIYNSATDKKAICLPTALIRIQN
jgi:hypothetical protein